MSFYDTLMSLDINEDVEFIKKASSFEVTRAINKEILDVRDFLALISPCAMRYHLDSIIAKAKAVTKANFGSTVGLYVPLYVSNYCTNACTYCGFSAHNHIERKVLTFDEVRAECEAIAKMGFKNILVVSGEAPHYVDVEYLKKALDIVREYACYTQIEVQPLDTDEYAYLQQNGLDSVSLYQETFHPKTYKDCHPKGKKADMRYRVEAIERVASANIDKIGMGVLLGLYDWHYDLAALAHHMCYIKDNFISTRLSVSFPRLRPCASGFDVKYPVNDYELCQIIAAMRLFQKHASLSLSTRESAEFRNMALSFGINNMSANSRTTPGGYTADNKELAQWDINDGRTVYQVVDYLKGRNIDPVFYERTV